MPLLRLALAAILATPLTLDLRPPLRLIPLVTMLTILQCGYILAMYRKV